MTKASRKVTAKDQATARRLRQSIPYHLKPEIAAFAGMHFEQLQKFAAGRRHQWRRSDRFQTTMVVGDKCAGEFPHMLIVFR